MLRVSPLRFLEKLGAYPGASGKPPHLWGSPRPPAHTPPPRGCLSSAWQSLGQRPHLLLQAGAGVSLHSTQWPGMGFPGSGPPPHNKHLIHKDAEDTSQKGVWPQGTGCGSHRGCPADLPRPLLQATEPKPHPSGSPTWTEGQSPLDRGARDEINTSPARRVQCGL